MWQWFGYDCVDECDDDYGDDCDDDCGDDCGDDCEDDCGDDCSMIAEFCYLTGLPALYGSNLDIVISHFYTKTGILYETLTSCEYLRCFKVHTNLRLYTHFARGFEYGRNDHLKTCKLSMDVTLTSCEFLRF